MNWPDSGPEPTARGLASAVIAGGLLLFVGGSIALVFVLRSREPMEAVGQPSPPAATSSALVSANSGPDFAPDPRVDAAPASTSVAVTSSHPTAIKSLAAPKTTPVATTRAGATATIPTALEHSPPAQQAAPVSAPPQEIGLVDVDATLGYQNEIAEGTGMILTSGGDVLTNNHVIDRATSITVAVVTTGQTFAATAVGTDDSADVAVLQLSGAPATATAPFGDSNTVAVGNAVIGVGNAGGVGGAPTAAPGTVAALDQSITATSEDDSDTEHLSDMIASNAQIQPGDSGGPLYNTAGQIIGMDTAGGTTGSGEIIAFSIPIDDALTIAQQIQDGSTSPAIQLGTPAFLGIAAVDTANGATVQQVLAATPAANIGIAPGDVITGLGTVAITSAAALSAALASHRPGDQVTLTWKRSTAGASQPYAATVRLAAGPAV